MVYHVVRRPLQTNTTNSSNPTRSGSVPPCILMPRYHYSRTNPTMTVTTTNNQPNSLHGSFKSTIIPLITNHRPPTAPTKREVIQIPIIREDGTSNTTNNQTRSVPVSFISETNPIPPTGNNNNQNGNLSPRPTFTNLLRPTSKYFQYHFNNSSEDPSINSNVPRLPSVSRRLSLTIPVTTNTDDELTKPSAPSRQIPIRLPQTTTIVTSHPATNPRVSSAVLRSSPVSNALQRQKTEIGENSSSSPTLSTLPNASQTFDGMNSSPLRRAEAMAREAIQGITRLQQQRNGSVSETSKTTNNHSPTSSRRVIINLKNNQTVSLDSRLSSALKPPLAPSSARSSQRNNLYHIPVLHEIQHPSSESSTPTISNGNYKNEFHMEIPVTNDQENQIETPRERLPSINQTLKSILKRSSSRETVSRKNVSFMNA